MSNSQPSNPMNSDTLRLALKAAAEVALPAGFLVGLAYYFGLARTTKLYGELGVDQTLLDFDTTDYLLRSLGVLIGLIPWLCLSVAGAVALFLVLRQTFGRLSPRWASGAISLMTAVFVVLWIRLDRLHASQVRPDPTHSTWILAVAVATTIVIWAAVVAKPWGDRLQSQIPNAAGVALVAAGSLFVAYLAFEAVRAHAIDNGNNQAFAAEAEPQQYSCVRMATDLWLGVGVLAPPANAIEPGGIDFRSYEGLRLFSRTDSGYLVFPDTASPRDGLVFIAEERVASITFDRQRNAEWQPCPRT